MDRAGNEQDVGRPLEVERVRGRSQGRRAKKGVSEDALDDLERECELSVLGLSKRADAVRWTGQLGSRLDVQRRRMH